MPGDPKTCRLHSLRCVELAEQMADPVMRNLFMNLAARWVKIALEIEETDALMQNWDRAGLTASDHSERHS